MTAYPIHVLLIFTKKGISQRSQTPSTWQFWKIKNVNFRVTPKLTDYKNGLFAIHGVSWYCLANEQPHFQMKHHEKLFPVNIFKCRLSQPSQLRPVFDNNPNSSDCLTVSVNQHWANFASLCILTFHLIMFMPSHHEQSSVAPRCSLQLIHFEEKAIGTEQLSFLSFAWIIT